VADNRTTKSAELYELAALATKLRTAIQYSIAQSLAAQFQLSEEPPPELRALLRRLSR
jgi:hypothetical protein